MSSPKVQVFRQGLEQQPVVVIDDFDPEPERLVEAAAAQPFGAPATRLYPGVQAQLAQDLSQSIHERVAGLVAEVFGLGPELNRSASYSSLVTTPPERLEPLQRLPHFDGFAAQNIIALVHHLSRAEQGGTAFFRHRATGFESMTAERFPSYRAAVNAEVARDGLQAGYLNGDTPAFERIGRHAARFNRLLIYSGALLHSGEIPEGLDLPQDPRTGRFSINTFLWVDPKAPSRPPAGAG